MFGVSFDTVAGNRAFAEKFDFPFPLLCDVKREIGIAYGACDTADAEYARRITYLIGPDGTIRAAWPDVKPAQHPRQVLDALV